MCYIYIKVWLSDHFFYPSWSTIAKTSPPLFASGLVLRFSNCHCMALHQVRVQIDYRAGLAYHPPPSWWLLTVLFFLPFCCAYRWMNYFPQKVVLHDPGWLSKMNICPLLPTDMFPGGNGLLGHIYISRYTHRYTPTHTKTIYNISITHHCKFTVQ